MRGSATHCSGTIRRVKSPAGVLALQGDFAAHARTLESLGEEVQFVRTPAELEKVRMLCMPGGESTVMSMLLTGSGLREPLKERIEGGMPVMATCAGMILLAQRLEGDKGSVKVQPLGLLDATIGRNDYGRQVDSFEADLRIDWDALGMPDESGPLSGMFIRAPRVLEVGDNAQAIGWYGDDPVLLRQGNIIAAAFHPEIAGDSRIHAAALGLVEE